MHQIELELNFAFKKILNINCQTGIPTAFYVPQNWSIQKLNKWYEFLLNVKITNGIGDNL